MTRLLRASWVIARRDYVATVWSRTFLIFLLGPVLPLLLGGVMAALTSGDERPRPRDSVQLVADAGTSLALMKARAHLAARLERGALPQLAATASPDPGRPALGGTLDRPRLTGPREDLHALGGKIGLIVDQARAERALGERAPAPVDLQTAIMAPAATDSDRESVARGGQFVLFMLTILLAGMMISNMVEEKASKVIELLAAAVPVDAIFFGKLVAILGASLTGIAVWATAGIAGAALLLPAGLLPAPAVGWPVFLMLGFAYFVTVFLLWGAIYLAIGAQAGSAREAQTMSMPMTLAQAFIYILASSQVAHPDRPAALVAAIVPWSSPFAMIGRAALAPALWPHLLALGWQLAALFLTIRVGAGLFRTNILKSGRSRPQRRGGWLRIGRGGE